MQEAAGFIGWVGSTALVNAMLTSLRLYPIIQIGYIAGFTVLVGAIAMFDLRLLGWERAWPASGLGKFLLPWSAAGLSLIVPAGLTMFSARPHDFLGNRIFLLKLALIALAGVNALLFHTRSYRSVAQWNVDRPAPALARLHVLMSLVRRDFLWPAAGPYLSGARS